MSNKLTVVGVSGRSGGQETEDATLITCNDRHVDGFSDDWDGL